MALPNSSINITPGSGVAVASQVIGGKEYQVLVLADRDGLLDGERATYWFQSGFQTLAANKIYFDLFNATGSGKIIKVPLILLQKDMAAQTGVPIRFDLARTTSVGTTGTTLTPLRADINDPALPGQITARHAPGGGAALGELVISRFYHSEETNVAAQAQEAFPFWPPGIMALPDRGMRPIVMRENSGLRLQQITSSVAGVYNVWVAFTAE